MTAAEPTPPRAAEWCLAVFLRREMREIVKGDLLESFRVDVTALGEAAARRKYWSLALASIAARWRPSWRRSLDEPPALGERLAGIIQDFIHGVRYSRHRPGFALSVIATLAVGIAATTIVFGLVNALVLRPLPYADPSRLTFLLGWDTREEQMRFQLRYVDAADIASRVKTFEDVAIYRGWSATLSSGGLPERTVAYRVSGNMFGMLGVPAALGRTFSDSDLADGNDRMAVLSHGLWVRHFGADPTLVGRSISLNGEEHLVRGIMPPEFEFPIFNFKGDLWTPLIVTPELTQAARDRSPSVVAIGRISDDSSIEAAQAAASAVMDGLALASPGTNAGRGVRVTPMALLGNEQAGPAYIVLAVAVGLVLLVACANAANLLLARGMTRGREMALRSALGASRFRLVRQLVTESAVLALAGGAAGATLAWLALEGVRGSLPDFVIRVLPGVSFIRLDGQALAFTVVVSLGTVFLFGLVPALRTVGRDLAGSIKSGGLSVIDPSKQWLRRGLIVGEVALSVVLLVATGLLARAAHHLTSADPGFDKERLLAFSVTLPSIRFPTAAERQTHYERLLTGLGALPGVTGAGLVNTLPFSTSNETVAMTVDGVASSPGEAPRAGLRLVNDGYVDALGMTLVEGRGLRQADGTGSVLGVVVNRAFARRHFNGSSPLGRIIRLEHGNNVEAATIVGLVSDVQHWALSESATPEIYMHYSRDPRLTMSVAVRTDGAPSALIPSIRSKAAAIDPSTPLYDVDTMSRMVENSFIAQNMASSALVVFGCSALVLTALGLHGLLGFMVGLRAREIGVRVALGASRRSVIQLVLGQSLQLALAGLVIGLAMAVVAARGLATLLFGVGPGDPLTYIGAVLAIAAVALVASWMPTRRALQVLPITALRE